jgi:AraC-like DNA-binding protein
MNEISELAGVSVNQLSRIVRMTATAGFLHEPQPGCIAHTALSAPFVNNLSYLDAAMFLAKTAAPTALHMTAAMQRHGGSESPIESAYSLAFNTAQTFQGAYKQRAKLQREWHAYLKCTEERSDGVAELLGKLDFHGLGKAVVVDVGSCYVPNV